MQEIAQFYKDDPKVAVVTIQTTFEGFGINNVEALSEIAAEYDLSIPIGHNGWPGKPSPLLFEYRARGTPWVVIIDKHGLIRFNNYYLNPEKSIKLIGQLKDE